MFIKGNPSSHKGWMSRFFFVKRVGKKRDPWKCEMHWRDSMYTLTSRTPDRSPNLASFLDAMRDKSYNAPELIQEDLLCFFGFSRRGVELVGDLDERMGKTEMLKLVEDEAATVATRYICHMAPDRDIDLLRGADNSEATTVTLRKSTRLPSFDFKKALADMDDEGEAEEEEEGEEEEGDATPSSSPRP
ncbi:hypothetical protein F511_19112 [Dorcoceras hygrometricum]|uniref:Uncharacterized protein n=1 Tax=Dorcoceras hygrometricum TaxID=472368 RepID=A0A2Z7A937_9LAMI|nr:hypothetical protein F511_19112 [Dorcoceras hygrometricum]